MGWRKLLPLPSNDRWTFLDLFPQRAISCKCLKRMAGTTGLEPAASAVTGQRSNQLNYVPTRQINEMTLSAALRVWVWRNTCSRLGSKAQTSHKHPNSFASDGKAPLAFSLCVLLQQIIPPRPRPFVNYLAGAGDRTETFTGFRTAGRSFGGFAPWSVALSTGTYSSSLCASTQRSMRPPRLISPRPT